MCLTAVKRVFVWEQGSADVAAHCQKGRCSLTFPYSPPIPRHSSGPLLRLLIALNWLMSEFKSLTTGCTHQTPGFCQLMQLNWLHTDSISSVTEEAASHDLKWVHPVGSIEILDCLNISQDLATSIWQSKYSWGVAVCILPLTPHPNTFGLLSGLQ